MLQLNWNKQIITTNTQANNMIKLFLDKKPKVGGFDTESTGLHIIKDKPFLFQFGFILPDEGVGYAYAVDIEKQPDLACQVIKTWHKLAETLDLYLAHNIKFDLHMLINLGIPYTGTNISDTMFYIRHAHDALTVKYGGPPLGLKDYASRYVDRNAKFHEKKLAAEKSAIVKNLHVKLKQRLGMTVKQVAELFKDPTVDYMDLPPDIRQNYTDWLTLDVPFWLQPKVSGLLEPDMVRYDKLDRATLTEYALYDIVYLLEIYMKTFLVVQARGTQIGIDFENRIIPALVEMERVGYRVDVPYLLEAKQKLKQYIHKTRTKLYGLAGQEFSVGQHALVKQILLNRFGIEVVSTGGEQLLLIKNDLIRAGVHPEAVQFIETLEELRTLEKWYSVYILRFVNDVKTTDRIYTTINQVGTVSGRVSCDFQQFPKGGIKDDEGNEIFSPRRMVLVTGGDYNGIVYLDYSQIELRFQALYTILVGEPDTNLCRAYMPLGCYKSNGELFDYSNPNHIRDWSKDWYYDKECTQKWVATDVHAATTKAAFDIDETHENFHDLRYIGKRVNFAKNYGAQRGKIREMFPDYSEERITKINDAYYKAFPGVKAYHQYCYARADYSSYTENLFGIRYYGVTGHKLINLLVQGSAAYFLKWKIYELWKYAKEQKHKTRWQMQIHDELSWEWNVEDSPEVFFEYQKIMQDWDDGIVPVVADMEVTTSNWKEKKEVSTLDELQVYLRN